MLVIVWSGIKTADLTSVSTLELVICGSWCCGSAYGDQTITVGSNVVKRVLDGSGKEMK